MDIHALQRILKEGDTVNGAYLAVDHKHWDTFMREIKDTPRAAFLMVKRDQLASFRKTTGNNINSSTYSIAILVVLTASVLSFMLVSRMIGKLDMVGVLKARD